jgi:hypothetical protein
MIGVPCAAPATLLLIHGVFVSSPFDRRRWDPTIVV